ncbi:serine/threonine-protein kinase [Roseiconus sp. JC912]|uniref:serine/threonine-protein kinase n=2 Tax=Pirellulaceae TaxID=2691357 RepID=UPI003A4C693B
MELAETSLGVAPSVPPSSSTNPRPMSFTYPPGSTPLPPYTIRRGVGVGGFGEVYFAVSEAGKEVALKRIQRNLEVELRGVSQCLNLKHPNLVSLFDICRDADGGSWVIMEYVSGANLRDVLDLNPAGLPDVDARRWFAGIAAGVSHLHGAGLVHRDLKPGNVFDDLGIVKVGDYGLSKYISASQRGGHTESVGTFHYMAPEIGRGQYGREIDIYALGIILYELLTGRVPFDGESCHEIIVKHMTALPDLSVIPSPYREVIAAALDKDPTKRPSTVADLIAPLNLATSEAVALTALHGSGQPLPGQPQPNQSQPASHKTAKQFREPVARAPIAPTLAANPYGSSTEEPLLRAVRKTTTDLGLWWQSLEQSPRARVGIGLLVGFILFVNTGWLLPALSVLAAIYVPYYIVRQMVLHTNEQPSYARANQLASRVATPKKIKTKNDWKVEVRNTLRAKHNFVRLAELNTSWLAASLTVLAMAVIAGVIGLRSGDVTAIELAPFFWMALVVLIGSQGILGLGKLWERDEGEGLPRRLVLAGVGSLVGLWAYSLSQFFLLSNEPASSEWLQGNLPQALYFDDGTIRASGMMAHFALLFGGIRWWKPVDPLRRTRLSLWSVAVVCVAAWGAHQLLPVPQPIGFLVAGGLAIATQMSAPWINPRSYEDEVERFAQQRIQRNRDNAKQDPMAMEVHS